MVLLVLLDGMVGVVEVYCNCDRSGSCHVDNCIVEVILLGCFDTIL